MSIVILVGTLIISPFFLGVLCERVIKSKDHRIVTLMLYGYLLMFSLFWMVSVPVILYNHKRFDLVVWIYGILLFLLSIAGCVLGTRKLMVCRQLNQKLFHFKKTLKKYDKLSLALWCLFFMMLIYQLYKSVLHASFDGDDAYYVTIANIANQQGDMYGILPYNGTATSLQTQHAIAPLPIFMAFLARISGIHSTVINHLIMPFCLIPLTYYAYFLVGERLFYKNKNGIPVFMILISLLQIYGDLSICTKEKFFLTRTWQGKSVYANLILTVTFFLMLSLAERQHKQEKQDTGKRIAVYYESKRDIWFFLLLTNMSACLMTSMSAVISGFFLGISGILIAIRYRNPKDLINIVACCIPFFIEMTLYLLN